MSNKSAVAPTVAPHEDPVAQGETAGRWSEKLNRGHGSFKDEIRGSRDTGQGEQTDAFRLADAERPGIGQTLLRKRNAFAQDPLLHRGRPFGRKGQEFLELRER